MPVQALAGGVEESGQEGLADQIYHLGILTLFAHDLLQRADRQNTTLQHGQGFCTLPVFYHRDDGAAVVNGIGFGVLVRRRGPREHGRRRATKGQRPAHGTDALDEITPGEFLSRPFEHIDQVGRGAAAPR